MNEHLIKYLSIVANLAILGGVVLVAFELRQNQTLMRAEMLSESFNLQIEQTTTLLESRQKPFSQRHV